MEGLLSTGPTPSSFLSFILCPKRCQICERVLQLWVSAVNRAPGFKGFGNICDEGITSISSKPFSWRLIE